MIKYNELVISAEKLHIVENIRNITDSAYVLRLKRKDISFRAGNYIVLGIKNNTLRREYSIYSCEKDDYLEVLIKELPEGDVSKQLKKLQPGDIIHVEGPFGYFNLSEKNLHAKKHLFIASGTGISPFHSFVRSYPEIDYTILHGVRYSDEAYDFKEYEPSRYILCTSGDSTGTFHGRVTQYLKENPVNPDIIIYLCGNSNMIFEAYDILKNQGVPLEKIHTEVYF